MKFSQTYLIFALLILLCSCRKQKYECSGNCSDIVFSGYILDKSLNTPLANQRIDIGLYQSWPCWLCSSKHIASGKSNSNGYFSITVQFDTSLLQSNYLSIVATAPENFITYAQPVGPGIPDSRDNVSSERFSAIDTGAFRNLRFDFYPRALLKIHLHRTSNIVPQYPALLQNYIFDDRNSGWGLQERITNTDTTLTIYTAANIFTKIVSSKQQSPTSVFTRTDSIKCLTGANNSIDITY